MADKTAGEEMVEVLCEWGVDTIFGLPGDGINGFMEALRKNQERIRFVQTRHEEAAAFAACGYAKFTGKLGVCMSTSGPGGIHLLNGLYDAKMDGQPVLAITGNQFHDLYQTHGQQDVRLERLFDDVATYNATVMGPGHVRNATQMACRTAINYSTVAHVTFPTDFQGKPVASAKRSMRNKPGHMQAIREKYRSCPAEEELSAAAQIINEADKVCMLVGRGALGAREEVVEVAEKIGAPVVKALLGKGVVPDDNPITTGSIGLLGTAPSQEAIEECDCLLMVGTSFPYMEWYPDPDAVPCVQIDNDPQRIGIRYPVDVGLVGDSRRTLQELMPFLQDKADKSFLKTSVNRVGEWWESMEERGTDMSTPMKPQRVAWELGKLLDDDCLFACDSGTIATWWARQIPVRGQQMHTLSGNLATMACGLPYAIGAQIAHPDRQVVAFVGDGGFSMLMAEMATAVKYDLPIKVVIIKNNELGQIKWEQVAFEGNPHFATDLEPIDFAKAAEAFGASGFSVEDPEKVKDVLDRALNTPGPVVVQAKVDPFTAPLPPKIKWEYAKEYAIAMAKGEDHPVRKSLEAMKDKAKELI